MPLQLLVAMPIRGSVLAIVAASFVLAACDPFGLPATRALEKGVADMLDSGGGYEMAGSYSDTKTQWTIDMQVAPSEGRHVTVSSPDETIEALLIGHDAYFRGQAFLAKHISGNPLAPALVKAAGNAWWKDSPTFVPSLPDFTTGSSFRSTFLGSAVTQRTDHQSVDGVDAVELSGTRADVFIASASPYYLLRIHLKQGVQVDGIVDADLKFTNAGHNFPIAAPKQVVDFSNLSTLPPIYTVVSVDTSACGSPCAVSATLRNLGGISGARAPSTVTFTMKDAASAQTLGTCQATVQPDVGYNATTTVSCTIAVQATNGSLVTATADNPGHA